MRGNEDVCSRGEIYIFRKRSTDTPSDSQRR
jgi:hypothetical protein